MANHKSLIHLFSSKQVARQSMDDVWVLKEDAICLANESKLHAVIVHLKNGTVYLLPKYGTKPFELIT